MNPTACEGTGARHFTIDRMPREDRLRILSGSEFNRAFTAYGFSPRVTVVNERRDTNAQGLDYSRTRADLSFSSSSDRLARARRFAEASCLWLDAGSAPPSAAARGCAIRISKGCLFFGELYG